MALHMYEDLPMVTVHIDELRRMIEDRLNLYRIFLKLESMSLEKHSDQWRQCLKQELASRKLLVFQTMLNSDDSASAEEDDISHWLLSLAYCRTHELTAIFVNFESDWIHTRFQGLSEAQREQFLKKNSLEFESVDILKVLIDSDKFEGLNRGDPMSKEWFEAPFEKVPGLLGTRNVYVKAGMAYFPEEDIVHLVKFELADKLKKRMDFIRKRTIEDERLADLLASTKLVTDSENTDWRVGDGCSISAVNIDQIAARHFPLCMRYIHELVRKEHFLKYGGKMQYGVFLKSIGMPYEEALDFWRKEFVQKMPVSRYDKKYEYLFKHHYGKVGGMISHSSDSCDYIIGQDPLPTQHHGCPFKHWNWERLGDRLGKSLRCGANSLTDIEDLVKKGQYRQACTRFYNRERSMKEGSAHMQLVHSPMMYTVQSMRGFEWMGPDFKFDFEDDSD